MKPRPAIVTWRDAWTHASRECDLETMLECGREKCIVESIGFVIERNKKEIILVSCINNWDDHTTYKGQVHIPIAMIKKVKYLKEK